MKKNGKDLLMPTEAKIKNITYIITFIADVTQFKEVYSLSTDKIISNNKKTIKRYFLSFI